MMPDSGNVQKVCINMSISQIGGVMKKLAIMIVSIGMCVTAGVNSRELSLAYFMSPKHPMNKALFIPFAEKVADLSGGDLTIQQYPGGALNSVPPKQYSILLDGIADIVFTLPGYTGDIFPMTNVISFPNICVSAVECTEALLRARSLLENEYEAKVLAIWANSAPVLLTRDKPVRSLEDIQGMKIRVAATQNIPFVEALGASAVSQPVSVVNQNLANGVIDAIAIDSAGIRSFSLHEPANYLTTWFPGSGNAFVLLMNLDVYNSLTDEEEGWVNAASADDLSLAAGIAYDLSSEGGLKLSKESGVELIDLSDEEQAKFEAIVNNVYDDTLDDTVGNMTVVDIINIMKGN